MASETVKANPTKAFFVSMLTRDITLDDCILDLIDNSIDNAWKTSGIRPTGLSQGDRLAKYEINVQYTSDSFRIVDNCGGMTLDDATEYAFTFGREDVEDAPRTEYTVGVYGIGMKRAIFKLGRNIHVHSTFADGDSTSSFVVPVNVPEWLRSNAMPWDFDLDPAENLPQPGLEISVEELTAEAIRRFTDPTYERSLIEVLRRDYMIPLMEGLQLKVNGEPVEPRQWDLRSSNGFEAMRDTYSDGNVSVEIVAGMWRTPPDDNEPDEAGRQDRTSGWYVVCNGRVVLAADRTSLTVWERDRFPRWHAQYSGFIGLVLFSSANPIELPMTTTKRSVNVEVPVYQRAVVRMMVPTRAWVDYTNRRKSDLEAARALELASRARHITDLPIKPAVTLPSIQPTRPKEPVANINYSVPRRQLIALAEALGSRSMPYRTVGLRTFDLAYEQLVDEDEGA